jgi:hypothetical protein
MSEIAGILALPVSLSSPSGELMFSRLLVACDGGTSFFFLAGACAREIRTFVHKVFPFNQFPLIEWREGVTVSKNSAYEYSSGLA